MAGGARTDVEIGAHLGPSFDGAIGAANKKLGGIGQSVGDGLSGMGAGLTNWSNAANAAARQNLESIRQQRAEYRGQLLDVAAVGASLYGLAKPAIDFEHKMTDVGKVMPDSANIDALGDSLIEMSKRVPLAVDGLIDIAAAGARSDITDPTQLMEYTEMVAKMSLAWDMSADAAGEGIGKIGNVLGMGMDDMRKFGDALNTLDDSSTAKAPELVEMMLRLGTAGKDIGLTAEQTAAFSAAMLDLGVRTETGSTALIDLFQTLKNAPNLKGKRVGEAFDILGIKDTDLQKMMFEDGLDGIKKFSEHLNKLSDANRTFVMTEIFGTGYTTANITKLLQNMDQLEEHLATVSDETNYLNSVQREYEKRTGTTAAGLQRLGSQLYATRIAIGDSLLGALNAVGPVLAGFLGTVEYLAETFPVATQAIVGGTTALLALGAVGPLAGYAFSFVREGFVRLAMVGTSLTGALGSISSGIGNAIIGARALGLAFLPLSLTVGAVALAITGAALVIRKYWEPLSAFMGGVIDGIGSKMGAAAEVVKSAVAPIASALAPLEPVFSKIGSVVGTVYDWFTKLLEPVRSNVVELMALSESGKSFGEAIGDGLVTTLEALLSPLKAVGGVLQAMTGDVKGSIQTFSELGDTWNKIIPGMGTGMELAGNAVGAALAAVRGDFDGAKQHLQAMGDTFDEVVEKFKALGSRIGTAIKEGIMTAIGNIADWLRSKLQALAELIPDWARPALGLKGISYGTAEARAREAAAEKALEQVPHSTSGYFGTDIGASSDSNTNFQRSQAEARLFGQELRRILQEQAAIGNVLTPPVSEGGKGSDQSAQLMADQAEAAAAIDAAMQGNIQLEAARAASLAAEKPRSITAEVQAPITVNNYGNTDVSGAVAKGVSQGANNIIQKETDAYVDG